MSARRWKYTLTDVNNIAFEGTVSLREIKKISIKIKDRFNVERRRTSLPISTWLINFGIEAMQKNSERFADSRCISIDLKSNTY